MTYISVRLGWRYEMKRKERKKERKDKINTREEPLWWWYIIYNIWYRQNLISERKRICLYEALVLPILL